MVEAVESNIPQAEQAEAEGLPREAVIPLEAAIPLEAVSLHLVEAVPHLREAVMPHLAASPPQAEAVGPLPRYPLLEAQTTQASSCA